MLQRLNDRLRKDEGGFTLIELLVVIIIIGILLAIAVPSYLGFRDRAATSAAKSNVRAAVPAIEAYYADRGNYNFTTLATGGAAGSIAAALQSYDSGLKFSGDYSLTVTVEGTPAGSSYCVSAMAKTGEHWQKAGPAADIATSATACS
jgi:type IV pilus assembly protein PilA